MNCPLVRCLDINADTEIALFVIEGKPWLCKKNSRGQWRKGRQPTEADWNHLDEISMAILGLKELSIQQIPRSCFEPPVGRNS